MNINQPEDTNKNVDINADQIIIFLQKVKEAEELKYEQSKKLLDVIGINLENFDEQVVEKLKKLSELQYELGSNESSYSGLVLQAVDRKTDNLKQQRKANKIDIEIKKISKVTNDVVKQTKTLQRDIKILQNDLQLLKVDQTEHKENEQKLIRYKATLKKLEDDVHKYNLPEYSIGKYEEDIQNLKILQRRKVELSEKLTKYMGASPNIDVLSKQVEEVENEYKELQQKFSNLF